METIEFDFGSPPKRRRFEQCLTRTGSNKLHRAAITTLQINVGKLCNQACHHCHVEAGPKRSEIMTWEVMERLLEVAAHPSIATVDLTGGAPEMNPHFREFVRRLREGGKEVIVRCNLTILEEEGYGWLPEFYAAHQVRLICSLPCYTSDNVSRQRGNGVFEKSIRAIRKLNGVGYGIAGDPRGLVLDLVYNPLGPFLPPEQMALEADYKRELEAHHGVRFNSLLTLANLPIGRFRQSLRRNGELEPYLDLLEHAFNEATVEHLMCRTALSVGWDGKIYDCDFNQMLEMEIGRGRVSIFDPAFSLEQLGEVPVATGEHCLGCTAGAGSSCGGALTA
jgi:radical SAM/Cys-rich protein